jgi:hypothetical protein
MNPYVLLLAFSSAVRPAACTCVGPLGGPDQLVVAAKALFVGRVVAIRPDGDVMLRVEVRVERAWKWREGGPRPPASITVVTAQGPACGAYFAEGEEWLVVAHQATDADVLWTGQCTGTDPVDPPAGESWSRVVRERVQQRLRWLEEHVGPGSRPAA